jgi:hypothetical protein
MRERSPRRSSLTAAIYLPQRWLPANQARLKPPISAADAGNTRLRIVPRIGWVPLRRLRPGHIERMYADRSVDGNGCRDGGLDEKSVTQTRRCTHRTEMRVRTSPGPHRFLPQYDEG